MFKPLPQCEDGLLSPQGQSEIAIESKVLLAAMRHSRMQIEEAALHALSSGDHWPVDGVTLSRYNNFFEPVLEHESFETMIAQWKKSGRTAHILDLFGSGVFLGDHADFDTMTGVRLMNREGLTPSRTIRPKWGVVEGNLFESKTWALLKDHLMRRHIDVLDLIIVRPVGGVSSVDGSVGFYFNYLSMLRRAYSLLSQNNGELYIQLPSFGVFSLLYQNWAIALREHGCLVALNDFDLDHNATYVMKIIKTPSCPKVLPVVLNLPFELAEL